jgi:hypothetical protein
MFRADATRSPIFCQLTYALPADASIRKITEHCWKSGAVRQSAQQPGIYLASLFGNEDHDRTTA